MRKVKQLLLSLLSAIVIAMDIKMIGTRINLGLNIAYLSFLLIPILSYGLYYLYDKTSKERLHPLQHVFAIILAIFMIIGNSFQIAGSSKLIFSTWYYIPISLCKIFGYYYLFANLLKYLDMYLSKPENTKLVVKRKYAGRLLQKFKEHPIRISFLLLIGCWGIYMIAFYPLILSKDPSFQIKQFFNIPTKYIEYIIPLSPKVNLTAHHPVLHTLLLGGCIKIGQCLGNDNFGLFVYAMIQTIILAFSFAVSIAYLYKKTKKEKTCLLLILIYGLVPVFPFYAMSAVKDTIYTALIILYVIFLLHLIENQEKLSLLKAILLFILILLITLFRNNGIYVIVLSMPFVIFSRRKEFLLLSLIFIGLIGSYFTYNKILLPALKIPSGSKREALSVPFQQSARYVKEHADEVTEEEKKAIDHVLGYDDLAARYNPVLADPVKNQFNKYATDEELKNYFKIWFQQFLKHPKTYIEATIHNTYGYIYPNTTNWYIYYRYNDLITEDHLVDYHYNDLTGLRKILSSFGQVFPYIPILGLIVNIGFNGWLLLGSIVYLIIAKKKKYLICFSPLYISFLICFVSPANTYFRYAMPYIFCMPFLIGYLSYLLTNHYEKN